MQHYFRPNALHEAHQQCQSTKDLFPPNNTYKSKFLLTYQLSCSWVTMLNMHILDSSVWILLQFIEKCYLELMPYKQ